MFVNFCISGITSYFDSRGSTRDFFKIRMSILSVLIGIGMTPALPKLVQAGPPEVLSVILDGRVVGSIPSSEVETAVNHLRRLKVSAISVVCFHNFVFGIFSFFSAIMFLAEIVYYRFLMIWRWDTFLWAWVVLILVCTCSHLLLDLFDQLEIFLFLLRKVMILNSLGLLNRWVQVFHTFLLFLQSYFDLCCFSKSVIRCSCWMPNTSRWVIYICHPRFIWK